MVIVNLCLIAQAYRPYLTDTLTSFLDDRSEHYLAVCNDFRIKYGLYPLYFYGYMLFLYVDNDKRSFK